jgi:hypothetical protein
MMDFPVTDSRVDGEPGRLTARHKRSTKTAARSSCLRTPRRRFLLRLGQRFGLALAAGGLLVLAGCGESGPPRYDLSGKVTHGGQPVPAGSVTLVPDTSKGNSGPAGSAEIKGVQYDTSQGGTGHVGGPHRVKITGLTGETSEDEFAIETRLFPDYEVELDLPKEKATQDIDVPGDLVMPKPVPVTDHGP